MEHPKFDDSTPLATVGRYVLYGPMAAGGIATVHYGRATRDDSPVVAVKRLHARYALDPAFATMFVDEARLAALVRHDNVIPVLDVVSDGGTLFLVMPYVHGESLAKLAGAMRKRRTAIPPAIATSIMLDVLHGLHAAHEARDENGQKLGIVHRDVSPQNVLVGVDGVARVFDFGVAKAQGRLTSTRQGEVKGKYPYMAPEQIHGKTVTARSDVYAAGVVLWETLVGARLFGGDDRMKIMERVLFFAVPPPSETNPDLGRAFDDVVLRALDRDADKRFASAQEMARALEAVQPRASREEVRAFVERTARETLEKHETVVRAIESRVPSIDATLVDEMIEGGFDTDRPDDIESDSHLETVKAPTPIAEIASQPPPAAPRPITTPPAPLPPIEPPTTIAPPPHRAVEPLLAKKPTIPSEFPQFRPKRWRVVAFVAAAAVLAIGAALAYTHQLPASWIP